MKGQTSTKRLLSDWKHGDAQAVLCGRKIKFTLESQRQPGQALVRVDWLRFTLPLSALLKPCGLPLDLTWLDMQEQSSRDQIRELRTRELGDESTPGAVAAAAGAKLVELLRCLRVGAAESRSMDYYTARAPLLAGEEVVGYVLAGGRSKGQASTVHFNLFGSAFLHIPRAKLATIRDLITRSGGHITRVDLAFDVFEGHKIEDTRDAYRAGLFDCRGKRPKDGCAGSWESGCSRTFYVGRRESGKLFRSYEKGHELFGPDSADPWIRYEVELRDNQRVITPDILTKPADYFAGAYAFCAQLLAAEDSGAEACAIKCDAKVKDLNAESAAYRVAKWLRDSAGANLVAVFQHGGDILENIILSQASRTAKRLAQFDVADIRAAFSTAAERMRPGWAVTA